MATDPHAQEAGAAPGEVFFIRLPELKQPLEYQKIEDFLAEVRSRVEAAAGTVSFEVGRARPEGGTLEDYWAATAGGGAAGGG